MNNNAPNNNMNNININNQNNKKASPQLIVLLVITIIGYLSFQFFLQIYFKPTDIGNGRNGYTETGKVLKVREKCNAYDLQIKSIGKYKSNDSLTKGEFIKVEVEIDAKDAYIGAIPSIALTDENKEELARNIMWTSFPNTIENVNIRKHGKRRAIIYLSDEMNENNEYYVKKETMDNIKYLKISIIATTLDEKLTENSKLEDYYLELK